MFGKWNPMYGIDGQRLQTWVAVGVSVATAIGSAKEGGKNKKESGRRAALVEQAERERNEGISRARGQIDTVFDSAKRQRQHADFAGSLRGYLESQLNRKRVDTGRNLKFALAKQGLTGGSVAVDSGKRLGDEFAEAAIGNERTVAGEAAQLKAQDEQARQALKLLAGSGMSLTEANRRALTAGQTTLATADSLARTKGLGDVFADTAATYKGINERAELRRGYGYNQRRTDLYGGGR